MFIKKFKKVPAPPTALATEKKRVLDEMLALNPDTDHYRELLATYEKLDKLDAASPQSKKSIPPEVWVPAATTVVVAVGIMAFEQSHVISTKVQSFIPKPKI